jgi:hypothetical protein
MNGQLRSFERIDPDKNGGGCAQPLTKMWKRFTSGSRASDIVDPAEIEGKDGEISNQFLPARSDFQQEKPNEPTATAGFSRRNTQKSTFRLGAGRSRATIDAPDEVRKELMTGLDAIISGDTPDA